MKWAITGATSGVGMRFCEVAREAGEEVAGLVRDPARADAKRLESIGVRLVRGDLDDVAALREVARGADAFVHMAAHVGGFGTREQFERVNVDGTRHALEAAGAEHVRRFVHLSSTSVYGRPDRGRVTEDWPRTRSGQPYDDTKTDAEALAFDRGRALGLEVAAVRPPIIYGPYDRNFLPRVLESLAKRRFVLVSGGRAPLNVVWVDHVVDVLRLGATHAAAPGEAFNVMDEVDRRPPSVREVAETIAREAGLPAPKVSLPYRAAMAIAWGVEAGFRVAKVGRHPPITPFDVKILTRDVIYDASKAARVLGWKPTLHALDGLARFAREARAPR